MAVHLLYENDVPDGFGETMEPLDIDDDDVHLPPVVPPLPVVPRYPRRIHGKSDRYGDYIEY